MRVWSRLVLAHITHFSVSAKLKHSLQKVGPFLTSPIAAENSSKSADGQSNMAKTSRVACRGPIPGSFAKYSISFWNLLDMETSD
jgi:hypothetical protein